jgi:hypothetical protein
MGMFDTFYVAQSLIEKAIEGTGVVLEPSDGYYSFQTKDLDNCLLSFFLKEDNSFVVEKQEYEYTKSDIPFDISDKKKWSLNSLQVTPVGEPQMITDSRSCYIDFYDFYYTKEERVFVTFTAHVKDGRLVEVIKLKEVDKTNLEEEAIRTKKQKKEWDKITSSWQWRLATHIYDIRSKLRRLFYPITRQLDNLDSYLRKQAKSDYPL